MPHYDVRNCGVKQIQQSGAKFGLLSVLFGDGFEPGGGVQKSLTAKFAEDFAKDAKKSQYGYPSFVFVLEYTAIFHHKGHRSERIDVVERVAVHGDDVGEGSGCYYADLACHIEH